MPNIIHPMVGTLANAFVTTAINTIYDTEATAPTAMPRRLIPSEGLYMIGPGQTRPIAGT